jgi:hypothetical protein
MNVRAAFGKTKAVYPSVSVPGAGRLLMFFTAFGPDKNTLYTWID